MTPRFDPTRAIIYDLAQGQLRDDEGASRLNLPFASVARLLEQAGADVALDFGRNLGVEIGRRVAARLDGAAGTAAWAEHFGGHLALLGLGNLRVERWGRALVLRVASAPEGSSELVGAVLEGALQRGLSRTCSLVPFSGDDGVAYLVLSPQTGERARALREAGGGLGQVVEQLHRGAA